MAAFVDGLRALVISLHLVRGAELLEARFRALFRRFGALEVDVVRDFGGLDEDGDFARKDFREAPVHRDEVIVFARAITELPRAELAHERTVTGQHPEVSQNARGLDFVHVFAYDDAGGGDDLELEPTHAADIFSAFCSTSSIPPAM